MSPDIPADDHVVTRDTFSNLPPEEPGSYPQGQKLKSSHTSYAELKPILKTSQYEDALRLRQVETHLVLTECGLDMIVLNKDDSAPPLPPAPRPGDPGYESFLHAETVRLKSECITNTKQRQDMMEQTQLYCSLGHGFSPDEPYPAWQMLEWLNWFDSHVTQHSDWPSELQYACPIHYKDF